MYKCAKGIGTIHDTCAKGNKRDSYKRLQKVQARFVILVQKAQARIVYMCAKGIEAICDACAKGI